jgi:hypothetical protein
LERLWRELFTSEEFATVGGAHYLVRFAAKGGDGAVNTKAEAGAELHHARGCF